MNAIEKERMRAIVRLYHAIAAAPRVCLLRILLAHPGLCVVEIEERLPEDYQMAQPLLSHHLRVLREAGLVHFQHDGHWHYYKVCHPEYVQFLLDLPGQTAERAS